MGKPHNTRNSELSGGISKLSRTAVYKKRALYKKKKVVTAKKPAKVELFKTKKIGGDKNGSNRKVAVEKSSRFYPTEDCPKPMPNRKNQRPTKLRPSIVPGAVLVLLAGRYRGKRVVCLKQLESGLLLVNGPFKVNGVSLRRVNAAYVIATSTVVDISKMKIDPKFNDDYFKRPASAKKEKSSGEFFDKNNKDKKAIDASRIADQKAVDKELMACVKAVPELKKYLNASFSLKKGQYPHEMKF
eukprot:Nk52_evm17s311 gene=Nk52_evmTU17s311